MKIWPLFVVAFVACTGGGGAIGGNGGSSGASSSGGSSSGGSSGGSSSGAPATCTEFVFGQPLDPAIGGAVESRVTVQSVLDYSSAAVKQVSDLTVACKDLAVTLGASVADQSAADANTEPREKLDAWCKLAVVAIGTTKASAGGTLTVTSQPPVCRLPVSIKAECQGRCAGTGPCDVDANPMVCTGGELANGFCEGGKLEGGCKVEAKCDASCDATVAAKASCPQPTVSVAAQGASDEAAAATLEAALESELPAILALREQCKVEADVAAALAGNVSAVTDIKAACIPAVVRSVTGAVQDVQACLEGSIGVTGAVQ
jgi:hypothetical protein